LHPRAIDLGLERVSRVWRDLRPAGFPCPVVTVGGTNGKGSCVAMLDAVLRSAGYRVGSYTSPHLLRYNERVRIHGREVSDEALCSAFGRVDQARGDESLTYFEFGTLAALDLFMDADLDLVVMEVGLGGRLDAVNLIDAEAALITTVGLDHTAWLGTDLDSIAREKAGIFRAGRPAVIGQPDPPSTLLEAARSVGARAWIAGRDFSVLPEGDEWCWCGPRRKIHGLPTPARLSGKQTANAAAVLMVLECLRERFPVGVDAMRAGFRRVSLPGRLQVIPGDVSLVLDVAHNVQAAANLAVDLLGLPCTGRTLGVFGCLRDKDVVGMACVLGPLVSEWHLATLPGERGLDAWRLQSAFVEAGITTQRRGHPSVEQALQAALASAEPADRILVTGSFLTVAAVLAQASAGGRAGMV
jgi:dihydrofolate synthase/folylpolyglutamate synthase